MLGPDYLSPLPGPEAPSFQGPDTLHSLLASECGEEAQQMLSAHHKVLMNFADASLRTPTGVSSFCRFLQEVDALHRELTRLRLRSQQLERRVQELSAGQSAEHQARCAAEAQAQRARQELSGATQAHRHELHAMQQTTQSFTRADHSVRVSLSAEAYRQSRMNSHFASELASEAQQRKQMLDHLEVSAHRARQDQLSYQRALEEERAHSAQLQLEIDSFKKLLFPWEEQEREAFGSAAAASHALAAPQWARLPVFALRWLPHTLLDSDITWSSVGHAGLFGLMSRLCSGDLTPEDGELQLSVYHVKGQLFCPVDGPREASRLAALLAFQALRRDTDVIAVCQLRPIPQALSRQLEHMSWQGRGAPAAGVGSTRLKSSYVQPDSAEALLRGLLRGCPWEKALLEGLHDVRPAH